MDDIRKQAVMTGFFSAPLEDSGSGTCGCDWP